MIQIGELPILTQGRPTGPVFVASDLHLGVPDHASSLAREKHFVQWLKQVREEASEIILLGDVFDFWFEYRRAVPKYHTRLLGALAETVDGGVPIQFFIGNHDLWARDYFPQELGIPVHRTPMRREWFGRKYFLAHGDGLGPGDHMFKFTRKVFVNPFFNWCFRVTHPDVGLFLGQYFSGRSAAKSRAHDEIDYGPKERLLQFVQDFVQHDASYQHFVFGHRHLVKRVPVGTSELICIGDWISKFSYLRIDANGPAIEYYPPAGA